MLIRNGMELNDYFIVSDASITDAMLKIEKNGNRGIMVINNNNQVIGVATDGDIRKSLIRGVLPNTLLKDIINTNFKFIDRSPEFTLAERVRKIFDLYSELEIVPIVDDSMKLLSVATRRN
tara:strand:+ start:526 stop:888 length:363 start_codon:yes stop_codon:yes gene_type:complete